MFRPEEHMSSDWKTSLCAMDKWIKKYLDLSENLKQ